MKTMPLTLIEHKSLYISPTGKIIKTDGDLGIPEKSFADIEAYIYTNSEEASQFLVPGFSSRYGGRILKAKQYVGVLETKSGLSIEILPKIARTDTTETRAIFLTMLKALKVSPFKHFNKSTLNFEKMHILEIFITMFCEELSALIKRGIKCDYISNTDNSLFLKGRLEIAEHLQKNIINRERFYITFDEYQKNRVENRIIRTTLEFLYSKSTSNQNKKRLRESLFAFDEVEPATDIKKSFAKVQLNRQMKDYALVLDWCEIFLSSQCTTPFKGSTLAFALLFDMNRIFEDYVASCLRRDNPEKDISTQVSRKYLIESPRKEFKLKPDIIIDDTVVADTKWKILDSYLPHNGISQSDIYQMYAYGKKYKVKEILLIYPYTPAFPKVTETTYTFEEHITLRILAFDCKTGTFVESV